jgi:2-amino-4-hydroxy-6-hydroxymethyldihydropteridine diphosphokinase
VPRGVGGDAGGGAVELRAVKGARAMNALWRAAYVAIGSNLNSPAERVREAFERLIALPAVNSLKRSRLYLSVPMGPQDQPQFVNAAAGFLTQVSARHLLEQLLGIERDMGRDRNTRWGPRVIDLDLLWMVDVVVDEPGLTVPHPGVSMRNFVLYPLTDIAPELTIPGLGTVHALLRGVGCQGISVLD